MKYSYKDYKHLLRLLAIFLLGVGVFLIARALFTPASFGEFGHYRGDSLRENMGFAAEYAGMAACKKCHEAVYTKKSKSKHKGLSCETCHGPALRHSLEPKKEKIVKPGSKDLCHLCHSINSVRRKDFPQVDFKKHNPGEDCLACHDSHDPL